MHPAHSHCNSRHIINFPTKAHWRYPSKPGWIESGLKDLKKTIVEKGIGSVALGEQRLRLQKVAALIIGFESPYGLELLATVDFLMNENSNFSSEAIVEKLWSERKKAIFQKQHIEMAIERLTEYRGDLYPIGSIR